jgi:hypothetical protein
MKINSNVLLIGGAAIAAGAYLVYKKTKENKEKSSSELDAAQKAILDAETKAAAAIQAAADAEKQKANSLENPNSYASKVAKIQLYLGVKPDGIVGGNTIKALVTQMSTKFTEINASNVDAILNEINLRRTAASQMSTKTTTTSSKEAVIKFAKDFENTMSNSANIAELMKDFKAPIYTYDVRTKKDISLGKTLQFKKGEKFRNTFNRKIIAKGDDGYIFVYDSFSGKKYMFDPKFFSVKKYQ